MFYSKRIRDLIEQFSQNGDLNEKTILELRNTWILPVIFSVPILMIVLIKGYHWISYPLLVSAAIAVTRYNARNISNRYIIPYSAGEIFRGTVESAELKRQSSSSAKGWHIKYSFVWKDGQTAHSQTETIIEKYVTSTFQPKKGDILEIYVDPKNRNNNAPYIEQYFKKYCLSNASIQSRGTSGG